MKGLTTFKRGALMLLCATVFVCAFPLAAFAADGREEAQETVPSEPIDPSDDLQDADEPLQENEEPPAEPAEESTEPDEKLPQDEREPEELPEEAPIDLSDLPPLPEETAEQANLEDVFTIARKDGAKAAELLNTVQDAELFEALLTEILTIYYTEECEAQKQAFLAAVDPIRAGETADRFERAKQERDNAESLDYVTEEILVVFAEDSPAAEAEFEERYSCETDDTADAYTDITVVSIPVSETVESAVEKYSADPAVASAQPNYIYTIAETAPSDTGEWYFDRVGAHQAWVAAASAAHQKVRVAVIDTGVSASHPDLQANVNRRLCVDAKNPSLPLDLSDTSGHGTHVAGIIAATANNGIGIAGIASGEDNSCVEIISADTMTGERGETADIVRAINWAAANGAKVMNMSFGVYVQDPLLTQAIDDAVKSGITVVCAAGNDSTLTPHYPSDLPSVIGVIATNQQNTRASFSNYGPKKTISAPGTGIKSTYRTNSYAAFDGTSMATPSVSASAALLYSVVPDITPVRVKSLLCETAVDLGAPGFDEQTGWGNVNAGAAVRKALGEGVLVGDFVERVFKNVLNRSANADEVWNWTACLKSKSDTAASFAASLLFSDKFADRGLSDSAYLDVCYKALLGRSADSAGKAFWLSRLYNGMSRGHVLSEFIKSAEFKKVCADYGITAGSYASAEARDKNVNVTSFVTRLYRNCLNRAPDPDGLNYWCRRLLNRDIGGIEIAKEFFFSKEFTDKKHAETVFVDRLYTALMNRSADSPGKTYWVTRLKNGASRLRAFAEYVNSAEYRKLCAEYGIAFR